MNTIFDHGLSRWRKIQRLVLLRARGAVKRDGRNIIIALSMKKKDKFRRDEIRSAKWDVINLVLRDPEQQAKQRDS